MEQGETELEPTLGTMQRELEDELTTIGTIVGQFRSLDRPEGEDLARNAMRAYEAVADVLRMVRQLREEDGDAPSPADDLRADRARRSPEVIEASAAEFFRDTGAAD